MGQSFGRVLRPQILWRHRGGHVHLPAKNRIIFPKKHQNVIVNNAIKKGLYQCDTSLGKLQVKTLSETIPYYRLKIISRPEVYEEPKVKTFARNLE